MPAFAAPGRGARPERLRWFRAMVVALTCAAFATEANAENGAPPAPPATSGKCAVARDKLAQEEAALAALRQTIAEDRAARATCPNPSACKHYDESLVALAARETRREARLEGFQADVARHCR